MVNMLACSGCFNGDGGAGWAYSLTVLLMLAVPFGMAAVGGWWLLKTEGGGPQRYRSSVPPVDP